MSQSEPTRAVDRRQFPRHPPREGVRVSCRETSLGLGRNLALGLVDVSALGARLALSEPLERGQVIEVGLWAPGWPQEVKRTAIIIWRETAAAETWHAGVVFFERLTPSALRDLCRLPEV